jgi:serine/threonine protein kinase
MSSQTDSKTLKNVSSEINIDDKKFETCIGSGGFGKVFEIKGTNMVQKEMDLREHQNLREISFLSTYSHIPFITEMKKCEIDVSKNLITMTMNNAGITLRELSKTMPLHDKIKLIPELLAQFSRIMYWMKQENILHCDIKPANICIQNGKVTLIDWGFVQKSNIPNKKLGTPLFYDPYSKIHKVDIESEMFAFGISLCYFLMSTLNYDKWEEFCEDCEDLVFDENETSTNSVGANRSKSYDTSEIIEYNEKALDILNIEMISPDFFHIFGNHDLYEILESMVDIDKNDRIKLDELWEFISLDLKLKYSLTECYSHKYEDYVIKTKLVITNTSMKTMGMIIDWLINIKFHLKIKRSLFNAIQLLFRYLKNEKTVITDIPNVAIVCLYLSNIFNNEYILTVKKCSKYCNLNKTKIYELIKDVLSTLNYEVFPEPSNIETNKNNEDSWRYAFLNFDDKSYIYKVLSLSQDNFVKMYNENIVKKSKSKKSK